MDIIIGAIVIGFFAFIAIYLKHHQRAVVSAGDDQTIDTSKYTLVHDWQVYMMVFLSAPAAVAGGDVLISHYFVSDTHLPQIGLAGAWAALVSNAATVAILFSSYKRRRSTKRSRSNCETIASPTHLVTQPEFGP